MSSVTQWAIRNQRRLFGYGSAQLALQVLSGITGIILVRSMDKANYAWFTITSSLIATISILSDSGLTSASTSLGGPIVGDQSRFSGLIRTTRRLRYQFSIGAAIVTVPVGWWMLDRTEAPITLRIILLGLVMATAVPATEGSILTTVNRLYSRLRLMAVADGVFNASRLLTVVAGAFAGLNAIYATLAGTIAQWCHALVLRQQTRDILEAQDTTEDWNPQIIAVVRHILPLAIFQCVQGHLTTWILSWLATSSEVADVGALNRLSIVYTLLTLPVIQIMAPAIARSNDQSRLRKLCLLTIVGAAVVSGLLASLVWIFSNEVLWLLGSHYANLTSEVRLFAIYQAAGFLSTTMWSITMTKGWVRSGWVHIPITLASQAAAVTLMDLSSVRNAIIFSSISSLAGILVGAWLLVAGLRKTATQAAQRAP